MLGTGETDPIGHGRYTALRFCGEYLYLQTDAGPRLIDPETLVALPLKAPPEVQQNHYRTGLLDCSMAGDETILWFDKGKDVVVWQTIDGARSGEIRGFARAAQTADKPLLDAIDAVIVGVPAAGHRIEATALPAGMRLSSVTLDSLQPYLADDRDRPTDFTLISPNLLEVSTFDWIIAVLDVNFDRDPAMIRDGVILGKVVPGRRDEVITWPVLKEGQIVFQIRINKEPKDCRLVAVSAAVMANCTPLAQDYQPFLDRLYARLGDNRFEFDISPSQRWVAWDEFRDPYAYDGEVIFYLARVSDVMKP
jgi:hypothetical protein